MTTSTYRIAEAQSRPGGGFTLRTTGSSTSRMTTNGVTTTTQGTSDARSACDATGSWIDSMSASGSTTTNGQTTTWSSVTSYQPAWQGPPGDLYVGRSWTVRSTLTSTTHTGGNSHPSSHSFSATYTVVGRESISVPAGTFGAAWVVDYLPEGATSVNRTYYVDGVGMVRDEYQELTAYTP